MAKLTKALVQCGYLSALSREDLWTWRTEQSWNTAQNHRRIYIVSHRSSLPRPLRASWSRDQRRDCDEPPSEQWIPSLGAKRRFIEICRRNDNKGPQLRHSPSDTTYTRFRVRGSEDDSTFLERWQCHYFVHPHAKHHVDEAMEDWRTTTNLPNTVTELFERVNDVENASQVGSNAHAERSLSHHSRARSRSRYSCRSEYSRLHSSSASVENFDIDHHNFSQRSSSISLLKEPHLRHFEILSNSWQSIRLSHHLATNSFKLENIALKHLPKVLKSFKIRFTDVHNSVQWTAASFMTTILQNKMQKQQTHAGANEPQYTQCSSPHLRPRLSIDIQNDLSQNGLSEGAVVWLFHFYICNQSLSIIRGRTSVCDWSSKCLEGNI